jgi:hypothetical protein
MLFVIGRRRTTFVAPYTVFPATPSAPETDEVRMINPPCDIISIACFIRKYASRTLMPNRASKNASSTIEIGLNLEVPSFTNSTSMRPYVAFTFSISVFVAATSPASDAITSISCCVSALLPRSV